MRIQGIRTRFLAEYVEKEICYKALDGLCQLSWCDIQPVGDHPPEAWSAAEADTGSGRIGFPLADYTADPASERATDGCLFGEVRRTVGTGQVLAYVRFRKLSCVVEASSIVGSGKHGMGANAMVFYDKRARSDVLHNAELHL